MHTQMADWSGDSINRKSTSGEVLMAGSATLRKVHKSELLNVVDYRKRVLHSSNNDGRGIALLTSPGILGNAGQTPIAN